MPVSASFAGTRPSIPVRLDDAKQFSGGWVCGAVRYECAAKPEELQMFKCHCRDCQRISGGPYSAVVYMPASAFSLTKGTIARYSTPSTMAGHNQRGFCSQCGSRVTGGEGTTGIGVTAASLDDPSWFRPQFEMWLQDAQPWEAKDPNVPRFEQFPPPK